MKRSPLEVKYEKTVLSNGLSVVTEQHPASHAVCAGIWVCTGTRDEERRLRGISHFLEHLVFKGTKKRSAYELAKSMEAVGGDLNAYTSREHTCFHATSLKENLRLNLDVLCDLVTNARFAPRDFEREKSVVIQEIAMTADNPEEYVYDAFFEQCYHDHGLGWPILGTHSSLSSMKRNDVVQYYKKHYTPKNMVVSVAGNIDHKKVCDLIQERLGKKGEPFRREKSSTPAFRSFAKVLPRDSEQAHIVVGLPASSFKSRSRFEAFIVNALLGGGMTSRLYQNVREKRGLAYSVYSQLMTFVDAGMMTIYAGTDQKQARATLELIFREVHQLRRKKRVTAREVDLYKTQVRGSILLGSDDIENRMTSLGVNEMVFGDYRSVDQVIADIEKVSVQSVKDYIEQYVDESKLSILVLGGLSSQDAKWVEALE